MIEIIAGILTIISAILAAQEKRFTWMVGIVSCLLYMRVFERAHLWGMFALQILMIFQSLAGLEAWKSLVVKKLSKSKLLTSSVTITALFAPIGAMLYFEAFSWIELVVCWFSVIAMWLLVTGDLRNWYIWIFTNAVSVVLFLDDKLYASAATFFILFINSIYASWKWHKNGSTAFS